MLFPSFSDALDFLDRYSGYDLVFMDIEMPYMNGVTPGSVVVRKTSPWQYLRLIINLVIILINVGLICLMVRRANDEKLHPNLYKQSKKKHKKNS